MQTGHSRDELFMYRAIRLAATSGIAASPNPRVGAVIVANNKIIGEGANRFDGGPHAEVKAIAAVAEEDKHLLPQATVYVSLEPCSIFGRTPPCADLLIRKQVARVVVGCIDFTPGVCGQGLERLWRAGVEVAIGVAQDAAFLATADRQAVVRNNRPYITLKQAISSDGYVGRRGERVAITAAFANTISHQWRAEHDCILVGAATVVNDQPALSVRHVKGQQPQRIVYDPQARLQPEQLGSSLGMPTLWAVDERSAVGKLVPASANVEQLVLNGQQPLHSLLHQLVQRRLGRLLVEGGPKTLARFAAAGLWDEYRQWQSTASLGGGQGEPVPACSIAYAAANSVEVGPDKLTIAYRLPN